MPAHASTDDIAPDARARRCSRNSETKCVNVSISTNIEVIRRRYERLEPSQAAQRLADNDRLTGIAAKPMQPIVSFGAKRPHNRIGAPVRRCNNGGTIPTKRAAPGGRHRRGWASSDLQCRQPMVLAGLRATGTRRLKGNKNIAAYRIGDRRGDDRSRGTGFG